MIKDYCSEVLLRCGDTGLAVILRELERGNGGEKIYSNPVFQIFKGDQKNYLFIRGNLLQERKHEPG